jgi:hypothetical protein
LKFANVTPKRNGQFKTRVSRYLELVVLSQNPKILQTEVRWLSRSSFQRASSRGGLLNLGHSGLSVKLFSPARPGPVHPSQRSGSATIRSPVFAVNPPKANFLSVARDSHQFSPQGTEKLQRR